MDEFTLFKLPKEINSIPDSAERLFLLGLLSIVKNDLEEGCDLVEKALKINPYNHEIWRGYLVALVNKKRYAKVLSVLESSVKFRHPTMLFESFYRGVEWGCMHMAQESERLLKAMNIFDDIEKSYPNTMKIYQRIISLGSQTENLEVICRIISEVAEENEVEISHLRLECREVISFIAMVETTDADMICRMNFDVMMRIVKKQLGVNDLIGYFDACEKES
ncbi:tetratricopeptide repeat protein [Rosenbergiella collisarenosi]|uniref:tetratricopeptide repeat protein n=1 Tax=Rosenbergiella collisarenosi TaxID=1544695 RepID=UPI001F4EEA7F|nr:hypothetical protein [Rosenbergiella collisarenosi]